MNNKAIGSILGILVVGIALWLIFAPRESVAPPSDDVSDQTIGIDAYNELNGEKLEITTEDVAYYGDIKGYLAKPVGDGKYPGVVMIHEWWGLNENIEEMARNLAGEGYVVLAVDLYGVPPATTSSQARALSSSATKDKTEPNLKAAAAYLKNTEGVEKLVSLGWCFGGARSLELALSGETLDGTIIYYGQLATTTAALEPIDWPVLGIFGEADTSIPPTQVRAFESALNELNVDNDIYIYPGVGHAFANPSGANYAPTETRDAWEKTLEFLKRVTK